MIHWIIQKNLTKSQDLKKIKSALSRNDESWEEIEIAPFSTKIPKFRNDESFKITYGSTTLMLNAYKNKELREGVFYNPDKFLMSNYVDKWKENSLNFDGLLLKFGELNKLKSNPDTTWFIRPNHDGKEFNGRVQSFNELLKWSMKVCQLELPELNHNTKVWIAPPKKINKEWRLFIVNDLIVSTSRYMVNGSLKIDPYDIPNELIRFAKERIEEYRIDDVYVIDIAETDGKFKLIECNCFNGTGFYNHNIEKIVHRINLFIRKKFKKCG